MERQGDVGGRFVSARRGVSAAGVIVGLMFLAGGLAVFFQYSLSYVLARTMGVSTQGTIERLIEADNSGEGVANYLVHYSFVLPDASVAESHIQLSGGDWHSLRIGQEVLVQYVSSFPSFNCLPDYRLYELNIAMMIVFPLLLGGIGGAVILASIRDT
jgi:hypothetical protein